MYFNVFGEKVSRRRFKEMCDAAKNRRELIAAGLTSRHPEVLAGFNSDHKPDGDINEALSTLWYHDHRVDFTAQNTYKGLFGFHLLFN